MSSYHNSKLSFQHTPSKKKVSLSNLDLEIKKGELRLRYVQLLRDAHSSLGDEDGTVLLKETEAIWDNLSNQRSMKQPLTN